MFILLLKQNIKATVERKKKLIFKIWQIGASLTPFAAIIIGEFRIRFMADYSYFTCNDF